MLAGVLERFDRYSFYSIIYILRLVVAHWKKVRRKKALDLPGKFDMSVRHWTVWVMRPVIKRPGKMVHKNCRNKSFSFMSKRKYADGKNARDFFFLTFPPSSRFRFVRRGQWKEFALVEINVFCCSFIYFEFFVFFHSHSLFSSRFTRCFSSHLLRGTQCMYRVKKTVRCWAELLSSQNKGKTHYIGIKWEWKKENDTNDATEY